jgi:FKBP-type peptidyl-prolyl cis-trans isomerase
MPTDKRARQKAGRISRLEEQRVADVRHQRRSRYTRIAFIVGVVLLVALAISFITKDDSTDVATDATTSTTAAETTTTTRAYSDPALAQEVLSRERPDVAPPPADLAKDALNVTVETEGTGADVTAADAIVAHYEGKLADGTVFDSSWERGEPSSFSLQTVIAGWTEGIPGHKVGSRIHLEIGSEKAYGPEGAGCCPPDAPLSFTIDIVDVIPAGG